MLGLLAHTVLSNQADHSSNDKEDYCMEKTWVDFRVIKAAVSMQMLVEHYGLRDLRRSKDELRGRCPIHRGEGEPTFHINLNRNVFQCFSCKAKGNVLDFVAAMENSTVRDAALTLQSWFGVGESQPASRPSEEQATSDHTEQTGPINPPLPFQLRVDCKHDYGLGRGLSPETLEHFGAGLCISKGTFSGRFVIPLHDEQGQLVGYAGRSIDDAEPKYLFPPSERGFDERRLLWNLHRVLEIPKSFQALNVRQRVIVVEGFFAAMRLHQAGAHSVVSLLGSSMSNEQEATLCQHFDKVALLLDGDEAGRDTTVDCLQRLAHKVWVKAISLPDGSHPDQLSTEEIQTMLASL